MINLNGVLANPNLVSFLNGLHGKQVLVETKAGQKFVGVFGASSPELEIGLSYAWLKTPDNAKNILPRKDEIKEKMVFKFADIITVSAVWSEEKNIKGFATDREYHNLKTNGRTDEEELEVWECDNEDDIETEMPDQKQIYHKNGGWSVDEMFNANSRLHGVQSTFAEDMSQYTTVDFEATDEQKARAEQIAREIEQSSRSKFYSRLENDDDERDLDKTTNEDDAELGSKKRSNNNSFGSNPGTPTGEIQGPSEERRALSEQVELLDMENEKSNDEDQTEEKEKSETSDGSKKTFAFNPNALAFTPRQQQTPITPTQVSPMQQVPMGMVSGMQMQGSLTSGMVVPTGQPMIGPWHPGYVQVPTAPYQVYVPSQPMLGSIQGQRGHVGNQYSQMTPAYMHYNNYLEVYPDPNLQHCYARGFPQAMGSSMPYSIPSQVPPAPPGFSRAGYYP